MHLFLIPTMHLLSALIVHLFFFLQWCQWLESQVPQVSLAQWVPPDPLVPPVRTALDTLAQSDLPALPDPLATLHPENPAPPEALANPVPTVPPDPRVTPVPPAPRDQEVCQAPLEAPDLLATLHLENQVLLAQPVQWDQEESPVPRGTLVPQEPQDPREIEVLAFPAQSVPLVQWGPWVLLALLVSQVLESPVEQVPQVSQEREVFQVEMALPEPWVLLALKVTLAPPVSVWQVNQVRTALQVCPAPLVAEALRVPLVQLAPQVSQVMANPEPTVRKVRGEE